MNVVITDGAVQIDRDRHQPEGDTDGLEFPYHGTV